VLDLKLSEINGKSWDVILIVKKNLQLLSTSRERDTISAVKDVLFQME